jgi:hypothetical protein
MTSKSRANIFSEEKTQTLRGCQHYHQLVGAGVGGTGGKYCDLEVCIYIWNVYMYIYVYEYILYIRSKHVINMCTLLMFFAILFSKRKQGESGRF